MPLIADVRPVGPRWRLDAAASRHRPHHDLHPRRVPGRRGDRRARVPARRAATRRDTSRRSGECPCSRRLPSCDARAKCENSNEPLDKQAAASRSGRDPRHVLGLGLELTAGGTASWRRHTPAVSEGPYISVMRGGAGVRRSGRPPPRRIPDAGSRRQGGARLRRSRRRDGRCRPPGCQAAGGTSVGVLPGDDALRLEHLTVRMRDRPRRARNAVVALAADAVVAVGGEFGTLSEIALALRKWASRSSGWARGRSTWRDSPPAIPTPARGRLRRRGREALEAAGNAGGRRMNEHAVRRPSCSGCAIDLRPSEVQASTRSSALPPGEDAPGMAGIVASMVATACGPPSSWRRSSRASGRSPAPSSSSGTPSGEDPDRGLMLCGLAASAELAWAAAVMRARTPAGAADGRGLRRALPGDDDPGGGRRRPRQAFVAWRVAELERRWTTCWRGATRRWPRWSSPSAARRTPRALRRSSARSPSSRNWSSCPTSRTSSPGARAQRTAGDSGR